MLGLTYFRSPINWGFHDIGIQLIHLFIFVDKVHVVTKLRIGHFYKQKCNIT